MVEELFFPRIAGRVLCVSAKVSVGEKEIESPSVEADAMMVKAIRYFHFMLGLLE